MSSFDEQQGQNVATGEERSFRGLADDHGFAFACVPDGCDLRCCTTGHPLVLNPYEVHLVSRKTALPFDTLEDEYFSESYDPATGFPLVTIVRERSCGFLRDKRCSVYEARPLVCRLFPLGKYYDPDDRDFRTVMLSENPCAGFAQLRHQTVGRYRCDQETMHLDGIWEIWTSFVNAVEERGKLPDSDLFRSVFSMFIYNCDLPPAPGLTPEDYNRMSLEDAFRIRLETALEALPRLRAIFERRRSPAP